MLNLILQVWSQRMASLSVSNRDTEGSMQETWIWLPKVPLCYSVYIQQKFLWYWANWWAQQCILTITMYSWCTEEEADKKLPKEIGEPEQRLALHILNEMDLVPEHVERRFLHNPAYPDLPQVSCFNVMLVHLHMHVTCIYSSCICGNTHLWLNVHDLLGCIGDVGWHIPQVI